MQQQMDHATFEEPVGIIISRGSREEVAPRFWAYLWSEELESAEPTVTPRRAA